MRLPARLSHFPVSLFTVVMGLSGLTIAWDRAGPALGTGLDPTPLLGPVTGLVFLVLGLGYVAKMLGFPAEAAAELKHPVKLNFLPAISISLILLAVVSLGPAPALAQALWLGGAVVHLALTLYVMTQWMHQEHFQVHQMTPAWFIPAVGNVLVPIAGCPLGYDEISWFFFSVGILFWLVLLAIVFNRVFFHQPLPERLMPTLFILIAPPAAGFIAYMQLQQGELDAFARLLYYAGLFLTLLLLTQIRRFARLQFFLSWWAYSFPLAAITVATLLMHQATGRVLFYWIGWGLLILLTAVVGYLCYRTGVAVSRGEVCVPD